MERLSKIDYISVERYTVKGDNIFSMRWRNMRLSTYGGGYSKLESKFQLSVKKKLCGGMSSRTWLCPELFLLLLFQALGSKSVACTNAEEKKNIHDTTIGLPSRCLRVGL